MSRLIAWLRLRRPFIERVIVFLAFLAFGVLVGVVVHKASQVGAYGVHLAKQDHRLLKDYARQGKVNRNLEHRTRRLVLEIQANRLHDCRQGNHNHDATFRVLRPELRKALRAAKTPEERSTARANVKVIDHLFDASVPKHNCQRFVSTTPTKTTRR